MKYPKIKNALLCRILIYVVIIGGFLFPIIPVCLIPFIPEGAKVLISFALVVALLICMIKNFVTLMTMDAMLAFINGFRNARTQFDLPDNFGTKKICDKISHFGKTCVSQPLYPQPDMLQYKFKTSWEIYSKGTEKVITTYQVEHLDKELYPKFSIQQREIPKHLPERKSLYFWTKSRKKHR